MKRAICLSLLLVFGIVMAFPHTSVASKKDCVQLMKPIPLPSKDEVKEDIRPGVIYLAFIGGSTPKPNACGLIPTNPNTEWKGWGDIVNDDLTIENCDIVIGEILFERGIGTHAIGKIVYDLTGDDYVKFGAYGGIADDPGSEGDVACITRGSTVFAFSVDGKEVFKTPILNGLENGKNVPPFKIEFDMPKGSKELVIDAQDAGDGNSCDHSSLGDAKLLTPRALAVESWNKLTATWSHIKAGY